MHARTSGLADHLAEDELDAIRIGRSIVRRLNWRPAGDRFKVFVLDKAGMAHARSVTVGARTDKVAEIKSGLTGGETVVTYGAYGLEDSAKVVVQKR